MENITEEQLAVLKEAISKLDASFSFEEKQNATTENLDNNIFHILKIEELEIRHTNFLEWLLKNNKLFLQEFLQHHNICGLSEIKASKLVADEFKTYNPYKIENGRLIDLVIKFPNQKYLIVIENKINSGEGVDQLHDYHKSIIEHSDFTEYEKKFIFLTLNGDIPENETDQKKWDAVSHRTILTILEKIKKTPRRADDINHILINHYYYALKSKIKEDKEKMQQIDKIYELYDNYKDIFTQINQYIPDIDVRIQIIKEFFNEHDYESMDGPNAKTWLHYCNKQISNLCQSHGLPKNWIEFIVGDNNNYKKLTISAYLNKDENGQYQNFINKFNEYKGKNLEFSAPGYMSLGITKTLIESNSRKGYKTEKEFQSMIKSALENYFSSKETQDFIIFVKNFLETL